MELNGAGAVRPSCQVLSLISPCAGMAERTAGSATGKGQRAGRAQPLLCSWGGSQECPQLGDVSIIPLLLLGELSREEGNAPIPLNLGSPKGAASLLSNYTVTLVSQQ